jgi:hypothetical protein
MQRKSMAVLLMMILIIPNLFLTGSSSQKIDESHEMNELILELISKITQSDLESFHSKLMSFGPRYTGSKNCSDAGDWIYSVFSSMGYEVDYHHWEYNGFDSRNIIATLPGSQTDSTIEYLLTAHYDCTPNSLGADDDGSGIAALLDIAKVVKDISFPYTIRLIAFSGEEVGTYGSFSYARDAYRRGDNIRAVINPDMIGYADTPEGGRTLRFFYPERSQWIAHFAQKIANIYDNIIDMKVDALPNYIGADHQPFVDYGYDGVWVAHQDAYQWANTPEDSPEHLNFSYLTKATKLLLAIIAELASTNVPVNVRIINPYEGYGYLNDHPMLKLDLGKQWYWGLRGITLLLGQARAKAIVESTDPVKYVIFCIDDNFIYWDSNPPYEWNIQGKHFPIIGRHTMQVYVYTTTNEVAFDEMDLISFSTKCQYN